jgi:D-methionine transport system ATP-binding protein
LSISPGQLRLEQISLKTAIGNQFLLRDVSCEIEQGDRVALVGPSGAGKTSLLRLLNRLTEVSQGQIYFENQPIQKIPVLQLRQQIVLVLQESKLLGMTVQEALTYPLQLRGVGRSTIHQRLSTKMDQLHIPQAWLERTEGQLSVGQRQWVAIARALMAEPKILLLDEPTSALDAGRSDQLLQILSELTETERMTIVMANHQLDLAQQFCSRVLYLRQGQLELDKASQQVDWTALKEKLMQVEVQESREWE